MTYEKTNWKVGDTITAEKMNKIEDGVESAFGFSEQLNALIDGSITEITIPVDVTELCDEAFSSRKNLESVIMHDGVTKIGSGAFKSCSALESIDIPDSVTEIGAAAFSSSGLKSLEYGVNAGSGFCERCLSLESVVVGEGVTTIDSGSFNGCNALTTIDIASTVQTLGGGALSCENLESMTVRATTPPSGANMAFGSVPATCAIYVPASVVDTYKATSGWSARASYIQAIQE